MNTDYSYCSGVTCSIRKSCKRYLPDPPDTRLQWVWPAYNPGTDKSMVLPEMLSRMVSSRYLLSGRCKGRKQKF